LSRFGPGRVLSAASAVSGFGTTLACLTLAARFLPLASTNCTPLAATSLLPLAATCTLTLPSATCSLALPAATPASAAISTVAVAASRFPWRALPLSAFRWVNERCRRDDDHCRDDKRWDAHTLCLSNTAASLSSRI
jgi:hypothetical protein